MTTVTTAQVEPTTQPTTQPITQPITVPVAPTEVPVDHVRSHGPRCFWDFLDCRWDCSRA